MFNRQTYQCLKRIAWRECRRLVSRPLYIFAMIGAPLFCYVFFTTLMGNGLPTDLPVGAVDMDNTATSRNLVRNLDAFQQTHIAAHYPNPSEARAAMQRGDIYGFYYIPPRFAEDVQASRQPKASFYTNNAYLIAGSLLYRDMKTMSELANGAVGRTVLYAKGATEEQAMGFLQPIVIDTHAIHNPWLNYSVYLCNTILPGILMLLIFMTTAYSIGTEVKEHTSHQWLRMGGGSMYVALCGKLLPHTVVFTVMAAFYNAWLYGFLHFPCHGGILPMLLASLLLVLASQACGVFMIGMLPTLRLGLSFASIWGVLSFSISGFTFPVTAMHPALQALANLFPLRHYYLIYAGQALNGYGMAYTWPSYLALLLFLLLPFLVMNRLRTAMAHYKYIP